MPKKTECREKWKKILKAKIAETFSKKIFYFIENYKTKMIVTWCDKLFYSIGKITGMSYFKQVRYFKFNMRFFIFIFSSFCLLVF